MTLVDSRKQYTHTRAGLLMMTEIQELCISLKYNLKLEAYALNVPLSCQ